MNHRHTLLAHARTYGVLGAPDGKTLVPAATWAINMLRDHIRQPNRVAAPPLNAARSGEYRMTIDPTLPPDAVIKFEYKTEPITGITVYVAFYDGNWFVREIRGTGGAYYRVEEEGAEAKSYLSRGVTI